MTTQALRIGIIGAGNHSVKVHLPLLKKMADAGEIELSIICDLNPAAAKAAQANFGFAQASHKADEVITNADIEVIYIFGTAEMHYQYGKAALLSGKHVFVEKPPAPSTRHLDELLELADKHKKIFFVGFNRRFYAGLGEVREALKLSPATAIEGYFHTPSRTSEPMFGASSWLTSNAIHSIDALLSLMDFELPSELCAFSNSASGSKEGTNFTAIMRWKDGRHATFGSNNDSGARSERYVVHSTDATYEFGRTFLKSTYADGRETTKEYSFDEGAGFEREHKSFVASCRAGASQERELESYAASLYITELIERGHCGPVAQPEAHEPVPEPSEPVRASGLTAEAGILVLNPNNIKRLLPALKERSRLYFADDVSVGEEKVLRSIEAVITGPGGAPLDAALLESLPSLKVVGVVGASVKKYNPEAAIERGVPIINASTAYADAVAEFVVMQAILGHRRASVSHEVMRKGGWGLSIPGPKARLYELLRKHVPRGFINTVKGISKGSWDKAKTLLRDESGPSKVKTNLSGATFGIIGYGAIARRVIELLQPFGCKIFVYSDYLSAEEAASLHVSRVSLAEALRSDIVSLHRGLSERTKHSIAEAEMQLIKKQAVFINTARGGVVDPVALERRLEKGDMFACLDVFDEEPLPSGSPLRKLPNVFLTSHISGSTNQIYEDAADTLVENVLSYLVSGKAENLITTKEKLANMT